MSSALPAEVQAQIDAAVQAALSAQAAAIAAASKPREETPTERVARILGNKGYNLSLQEQLTELYQVVADIRGGA